MSDNLAGKWELKHNFITNNMSLSFLTHFLDMYAHIKVKKKTQINNIRDLMDFVHWSDAIATHLLQLYNVFYSIHLSLLSRLS